MKWWLVRFWQGVQARKHCPHRHLRVLIGDEIEITHGYRRLACRDCGQTLDGPARLAGMRAEVEGVLVEEYNAFVRKALNINRTPTG